MFSKSFALDDEENDPLWVKEFEEELWAWKDEQTKARKLQGPTAVLRWHDMTWNEKCDLFCKEDGRDVRVRLEIDPVTGETTGRTFEFESEAAMTTYVCKWN